MKTMFKVVFYMLMIGWLVFAFLSAWGMHQSGTIRMTIAGIGFFISIMGLIGCVAFTGNKIWWESREQLEKRKEEADKTIADALDVMNFYNKKIFHEDKDKDFIVSALNFYWNDANTQLQRTDLGDIERKNYEYQLKESKRLMNEKQS